ncbi:MAG: ABC transporter ATP-binding protein [Thermodesulfobacteriota bacterium]
MGSLIELEDITKIYCVGAVEVHALRRVSLIIEEGEFVAIMGPSGSGKSTLMNIIGCLDVPTTGTYKLEGRDVGALQSDSLAEIRNHALGFVFQSFNLLQRATALENVELPLVYNNTPTNTRKMLALKALKSLGLEGREKHLPTQLSGGQQQRVALARAIVNSPRTILADEPTGNVDTKTSMEIMDILTDLNRGGKTVLMITHEQEIASFAQRIVKLRDGLITSDTPRNDSAANKTIAGEKL